MYTVLAMPWESIEERLGKAFTVMLSFPNGCVRLPDTTLDIDEWLTSAAETDEEIRELNIPRIQFLHNRWPIREFAELEWANESSVTRRALLAMPMNQRTYILFSGGFVYNVIAAIEPRNESALYRFVLHRVLHDHILIPKPPTRVQSRCFDCAPDVIQEVDDGHQVASTRERPYLSDLLLGWIGSWVSLPVVDYWHEDENAATTLKSLG